MNVQYWHSPLGPLRLCADDTALHGVSPVKELSDGCPNAVTKRAVSELEEYFFGERRVFSSVLMPHGTPFCLAVWQALAAVPFGKVVTYGQLAAAIGRKTACRAVANAVGKNPLLIFLPCHRVVASDGLGGFSCGLAAKRRLLSLENVKISEKSPFSEKFFFTFP